MKHLIITLCSLGLMVGLAQAQPAGPGGPPEGGGFQGPPADVPPPPPDIMPPDVAGEIPEEIRSLHEEVKALRDSLRESRNALLESLGEDATREEKLAALTAWHEENAATIEEMQLLSQELRDLIRENRPGDPPFGEVPEEIQVLRDELHEKRQSLAESRRDAILALGEDPTDEAVRDAIEAWREANADAIAEVRDLAVELRDWFRENRPGRPGPAITPGMAQRRADFRANVREMRQNRRDFGKQMANPDLSEEERQEIIATFREEQRQLIEERKELKRKERADQGGAGGDRRPGG